MRRGGSRTDFLSLTRGHREASDVSRAPAIGLYSRGLNIATDANSEPPVGSFWRKDMAEMAETPEKATPEQLEEYRKRLAEMAAPQDLKYFTYAREWVWADPNDGRSCGRLGYRHKDPLTSVWANSFIHETDGELPPDTIELVPTPETVEAIGLRYKAEQVFEAWKLSQYIKFGVTERGYDTMLCRVDSPVVRDGGEFDLADAVAAHDLLDRDLKAFDEGFHKALSECDPEFRDFAEKKIKRDWDQYSEEVCPYDAPWLYDSDDLDKASWLPKEGHTWQEAGAAWLDEVSIEIETDIENAEYDREHGLSDDEDDTEDDK